MGFWGFWGSGKVCRVFFVFFFLGVCEVSGVSGDCCRGVFFWGASGDFGGLGWAYERICWFLLWWLYSRQLLKYDWPTLHPEQPNFENGFPKEPWELLQSWLVGSTLVLETLGGVG